MAGKICFVIMPFSVRKGGRGSSRNKWDDLFDNNIKPAVEGAGLDYECRRSLNPLGNFPVSIVNQLAAAEVVIAVLTELRPNVMYELGVRSVLKRKTIMLVEKGEEIPSDLAAYIALKYSTETAGDREELTENIRQRLKLMDGAAPNSDNPVGDHLRWRAVEVCKEWYEKENPEALLPQLIELVPSYVFELEPALSGVRESLRRHLEELEGAGPDAGGGRGAEMSRLKLDEAARRAATMYNNRGAELKEKGEFQEALKYFDRATRLNPRSFKAWSNRALVLVQLGRYDEAAKSARKVVDLSPNSAESWNALGKALFLLRRFDEAAQACKKAFDLEPGSAVYANNAGVAFEFSGKLEEALDYYRTAIRLNARFEHALYNSGKVLEKMGRAAEAEQFMQRALEINPKIGEEVEKQRHAVQPNGGGNFLLH